MRKLIILLVVIILAHSCRKESPFSELSGDVYYYGIAIPIKDVRVKVDENITYSGSEGYYHIPEIKKGIYVLRADKEGFDPFYFEMKFFDDHVFQNIQLVSEIYTSKLFGRIYGDYSGEPRAGLKCVLMNPNGTQSRLEAVSDSSGYYEISFVPEGYHLLKVIQEKDEIFEDVVEVGAEDVRYDIVFDDIFKFSDNRDGREYTALNIGGISWMTENLAFLPFVNEAGKVSSDDRFYYVYGYEGRDTYVAKESDNYAKYGVLYNWKAAINACPEGWRLPTDEDWKELERFLGMDEFETDMDNWRGSGDVAYKLKDSLGWMSTGNGDNSSWFNALPGGYIGFNGGSFGEGYSASFWTSAECGEDAAWFRQLKADDKGVLRMCNYFRNAYSVRCCRDAINRDSEGNRFNIN